MAVPTHTLQSIPIVIECIHDIDYLVESQSNNKCL